MGHQALCEPVTQIDRLLLAEAMPDARPDLIIALSQHAVSAYLENYNKPTHAGALVLAIGPATAAGLIEHGGLRVRVSDPANSEGLLAMSDIAALQRHQTVWLLTGEGGRDMVEQSLSGRCQLIRYNLYRRKARLPALASQISFKAIWVGSIHGLQQVEAGVAALKIDRQSTMLVASSARIANYARGLGWTNPAVCEAFDLEATQQICARIDNGG
jgi:uroporphyrinogen-III synthase